MAAVLLTIFSIAVALYAYRVISFIRAWIMLRNVPSPPASGLLSGHAPQLTTLKRSAPCVRHHCGTSLSPLLKARLAWSTLTSLAWPYLL